MNEQPKAAPSAPAPDSSQNKNNPAEAKPEAAVVTPTAPIVEPKKS